MIFITTGSQKFQFDRLLKEVDRLVGEGIIQDEVFAQIGHSTYQPVNYSYSQFLGREEFAAIMEKCTIVITHGCTGAIIGAVKREKKVIAVPRLAKYGEHVDNHQEQILKEFEELNFICACYDVENLEECYKTIHEKQFAAYQSNAHKIIGSIDGFINENQKKKQNKKTLGSKVNKYIEYGMTKFHLLIEQKKYHAYDVELKYILRKKDSDNLVVVFSSCTRRGLKARYNYMRTLKDIECNQLFILDDFAKDGRGSYYLGKDLQFNEEKATKELIRTVIQQVGAKKVIFTGSSKGAWASFNFGVQFENSYIVAGGPQFFLGTYLVNSKNTECLEHIVGTVNSMNISLLDHYLERRILDNPHKEAHKIYLHYSDKEHTYKEHIEDLIKILKEQGYSLEEDIAGYEDHSDISYYFPEFMCSHIEAILNDKGEEA